MGYTVDLGYPIKSRSKYLEYDIAKVRPFEASGVSPVDFSSLLMHLELETGSEIDSADREGITRLVETSGLSLANFRPVDETGLIEASIDVTGNYSGRIREVMGLSLRDFDGQKALESAASLVILAAGLADEEPDEDYWKPTDGNIRVLAGTLLDWTFQHPSATFYALG